MRSLTSKTYGKENPQPLLISDFSRCVVALKITFKKNQVERKKRFVNKAWLS